MLKSMKKYKFLLLFLFISTAIVAQDSVKVQVPSLKGVDLSNPNAAIYTHLHYLQPDSYNPEKSATVIFGKTGQDAEDIAIKLKKIFDGMGLKVDFNKVPRSKTYADSTYNAGNRYILFPYRMPDIYLERYNNKWYYSTETIDKVGKIYRNVYPWHIDKIQSLIPEIGHKQIAGIELWQLVGFIILLLFSGLLFFIFRPIVYFSLKKIQYRIIRKTEDTINSALKKLARPIVLLFLIWIIKWLVPSLLLSLDINNFIFLALNIAATVFWIYVVLKLVSVVMVFYSEYAATTESKFDDQLVPILNNFLNGIVVFLGFLKLLTLFGVQPFTVIAGASIGGLAVALASQDTVKNLIGTMMIFIDKPFHIGDWIEAGTVSGTVEKVGFRSTRVRAADTSIYQIPNSTLSEMVVNNMGLRAYRRYKTNLGIRYDTPPELIEAFVAGVRKIIDLDPDTRSDAFNVEFTDFGDSALLILVNIYFINLDWAKEQASRHSIHIQILKLAKELGVEFAFPSSTIYIEQFPEKRMEPVGYDISQQRLETILSKINKKRES